MSKSMKFNMSLYLMFIAMFKSSTKSSPPSHNSTTSYSSDDHHHSAASSSPIKAKSKKKTGRSRKKIGNKIRKLIGSINNTLFSSKHSSAKTKITTSTASSSSRSRDTKRSVRFSPICVVVDEDSCICGHMPLKQYDGTRASLPTIGPSPKNLEFRRYYVQIQKEFFRQIDREDNNNINDELDGDESYRDLFELKLKEFRA